MSHNLEKPFEYLRRKDGSKFDDEILKSWYISRAFVLEKLSQIAFKPDSNSHLHVAVADDSMLMLCVVRQIALYAHYINYHEECEAESCRNRTVITLVSNRQDIKAELEKEEYLCNLTKYCKYVEGTLISEHEDSYIDIEIHVVQGLSDEEKGCCNYIFCKADVDAFCQQKAAQGTDLFSIDTRKAVYASRIYNLGVLIDNFPAEDIHNTSRYIMAMNVFQYILLREDPQSLIDSSWQNHGVARKSLSNIFCTDCFESRQLSIQLCSHDNSEEEIILWGKYNRHLSKSEHARWVVEKLIMGFSPLNNEQRYRDESLSYDKKKRKQYRNALKNETINPTHIDLCSYADLRRINPNDLKYDSFLMLSIPKILEKIKE